MYSIVYIFELLCKGGKSFMMVTKDIFEDIVLKIPKCQYISDLRSMIERNDVFDIMLLKKLRLMNIQSSNGMNCINIYLKNRIHLKLLKILKIIY